MKPFAPILSSSHNAKKAHNENHFKRNISTTKAINKMCVHAFLAHSLLKWFAGIILENCGEVEINTAGKKIGKESLPKKKLQKLECLKSFDFKLL